MSTNEHAEKVLHELGLSLSQAKLYVALLRLPDAVTVSAVSACSNVARQDVYHLMDDLQEMGFVEKVISNPAKFKAIPFGDVTAALIEKRDDRTRALVEESTALRDKFQNKNSNTGLQREIEFILVSKGETLVHKVVKAVGNAEREILVILPWRECTQWAFILHEWWQKALDRQVNVRWLTDTPSQNGETNVDVIYNFTRSPVFSLKTLPHPIDVRLSVFDGKEVFMATNAVVNAGESPALWTNSPTMINTLKDYFEMKWKFAAFYKASEVQIPTG